MISSWLHSASLFLALLALLAGFWITLRVYRWYRRGMTKTSPYSKLIAEASDVNPILSRTHTIIVNHWPIVLVAITGLSLLTNLYQLHREFAPVVYTDHNVKVEKVIDKYHWQLRSAKRGDYRADFCRNAHNDSVLDEVNGQAGYSLETLRWTYIGSCWNVSDETDRTGPLGFWWLKDANGWALQETKQ